MLPRFLAIFAVFHGAVFLGAGNTLEHLVHESEPQHHQHHDHETAVSTDEEWINCLFCLDGVTATGALVERNLDSAGVPAEISSGVPASPDLRGERSPFRSRAPPAP